MSRQVFTDMQESRLALAKDSGDKKDSTVERTEDGREVTTNAKGQITQVKDTNTGTTYDYEYSSNGKLRTATITDKDGESDTWVKSGEGKWRSYDEYHGPGDKRNKPGNLQLTGGDWELNSDGRMTHSSGSVTPVPKK